MAESQGVVIQGLDLIDVIRFIHKKNKKFEAIILGELEEIMDKDSEEFSLVRKLFLDGFNDYTRSIMRVIFGDVEHLMNDGKNYSNKSERHFS